MVDFLKKNKGTIVFIAILVILVALYIYWRSKPDEPAKSVENATQNQESEIGQEILALQDRVRSIRLDESIFIDKTFQSLSDNSLVILNEPTGRSNPFAELTLESVNDIDVVRFVDVVSFPKFKNTASSTSNEGSATTTAESATTTTSQ